MVRRRKERQNKKKTCKQEKEMYKKNKWAKRHELIGSSIENGDYGENKREGEKKNQIREKRIEKNRHTDRQSNR